MIRLRADYGDEDVYSESMTGVIDRKMPQLYGLPEPGDGEWIKGDLISLSVDEPLNCFAIQSTNITFKSLTTGDSYPVNVGCNGNEIIIEPLWNADDHVGEDIEVTLVDFADLNYNINTEPIIWAFTIGGETGATNLDFDNDGIFDDVDNCRLTVNSNQQDLDEDGIGDACDEDIDGDDIVNLLDNCPYTYNPDQLDSDNDGEGDVCEADADGDEDGVTNSLDNCPYTYNPDQEDEDLDGIGDVCDEDLDGDGIVNRNDNCPNVPNPMQLDSNSDLVGDACAQLVNTDEIDLGVELIDLYPNPAAYQVHLSLSVLEKQHWNLHMMNSNGQVILAQNLGLLTEGTYLNRIDIGNLPNGMYIVQLISNRGVVSRKLIVNQ
ncbi:MAG: thrombospondin type 3 repeat-containing protein [Bacteroidota bacterium]